MSGMKQNYNSLSSATEPATSKVFLHSPVAEGQVLSRLYQLSSVPISVKKHIY